MKPLYLCAALLGITGLSPGIASASELRVVATIKPVHALVAGVMAGAGKPHLLIRGHASPHTYSLRPSDLEALQRADVILTVSSSFETFLASLQARLAKRTRIAELITADGIKARAWRAWSATDQDHDHDHKRPHGTHNGEKSAKDPHIWLDPANARAMVREIARLLTAAAPDDAHLFNANAGKIVDRLAMLEADIRHQLSLVAKRPYLVFHDAYQYFEAAFGLAAPGVVSLGDGRSPGVRRLRALRQRIADDGITCLFIEPQYSRKLADTIVEGTTARIATLDPLGATLTPGPDAYFALMRGNAEALRNCLGS